MALAELVTDAAPVLDAASSWCTGREAVTEAAAIAAAMRVCAAFNPALLDAAPAIVMVPRS